MSDDIEEIKRMLKDPVLVHAAMLRGEIAAPGLGTMLHVYGNTVPYKTVYMDGLDWQHHVEHDAHGVSVYPSVDTVHKGEPCSVTGGCGVVRVLMIEIDWSEKQELKRGITLEEMAQSGEVARVERARRGDTSGSCED